MPSEAKEEHRALKRLFSKSLVVGVNPIQGTNILAELFLWKSMFLLQIILTFLNFLDLCRKLHGFLSSAY